MIGATIALLGKPSSGPQQVTQDYHDGSVYCGQMEGTHWHGFGKLTLSNGTEFEAYWVDDKREGLGRETHPDGTLYEGSYEDGQRHGDGLMRWADGSQYSGSFSCGKATVLAR